MPEIKKITLLKLQANNFRNLAAEVIPFSPGINCLFGQNGQGKTNILEAIYCLGEKKSFRKNVAFPQLLSMDSGKPKIILNGAVEMEGRQRFLSTYFSVSLEKDLRDQQKLKTKIELWEDGKEKKKKHFLPMLFFNPFDAYQFYHDRAFRRQFFDHLWGMLDDQYAFSLHAYNRLLRQRHALFDLGRRQRRDIHLERFALEEEMLSYARHLRRCRLQYLEALNIKLQDIFQSIFSGGHDLRLVLDFVPGDLKKLWAEALTKDALWGKTTHGPHRDDTLPLFDQMSSVEICSLGQQKIIFYAIHFAFLEYFVEKRQIYPILLLDDLSGEIDFLRWQNLVSFLGQRPWQIILTTANEGFADLLDDVHKFRVENGHCRWC